MRDLMLRRFGIELESWYPSSVDDGTIQDALRSNLPAARGRRWHISCDGGYNGWEVKTPPSTWENWPEIRTATRVLRELGGRYSSESGMHVHLENDDMDGETLVRWTLFWYALEDALFPLVHRSRWDNGWCRALRYNYPWHEIRNVLLDGQRFRGHWGPVAPEEFVCQIGRQALHPRSCHGTSEIRLHHSSLDPVKQRGWLLLMQVLMAHAKQETDSAKLADWYDKPVDSKIQFMMRLGRELLPPKAGEWLSRHLAWRASRYSELTVAVV